MSPDDLTALATFLDEAVADQVLLPQRTLAAMVGVQRPSLNKVLKEFGRQGLIAVRYAAIQLVDRARWYRILEADPA
ncbi:helix-turn-helix domain-containing protein [Saccharomonospora halophila]|uniref:helix-turn-helix domain-containing protein n=1 Tax=Saccharomonospora halophila TaxID=129922 RepID=UPI0003709BDC|nr:helix-turn-helix domain-containing protein [Saccharomonospora halophila]